MAGEWPQELGQGRGIDHISLKEGEELHLRGADQGEKTSIGVDVRSDRIETDVTLIMLRRLNNRPGFNFASSPRWG